MFESPVKQNLSQSPDDQWQINCSVLLILTRRHDLSHSANAVWAGNCKFCLPPVI